VAGTALAVLKCGVCGCRPEIAFRMFVQNDANKLRIVDSTHYCPATPLEKEKVILEDLFSSVLPQIKNTTLWKPEI